jgi:TetR/AcrR family transcriptional regulator, cholesterol catabolism regulator
MTIPDPPASDVQTQRDGRAEPDSPAEPDGRLPIGGSALQRRIAGAAIELFYARGSSATTVREIAAACGLTPGALYNHFSSKEHLLYVLIRDVHLLVNAQMAAALENSPPDPASQLSALVGFLVAHTAGAKKQSHVANREFTRLSGERRQEITALRRQIRDRFAGILTDGAAQGVFSLPGGDDKRSAALTASAIAILCVHISEWTLGQNPHSTAELQDRYVQMAMRMAGGQPH